MTQNISAAFREARMALAGIVDPGRSGLIAREHLIKKISREWADATGLESSRQVVEVADRAVAGLWAVIAREIVDSGDPRPPDAATLAVLFCASVGGLFAHGDHSGKDLGKDATSSRG
jgi:hypothetical protein